MRLGNRFFILSVLLVLVIWGGLFYNSLYIEVQAFRAQVKNHLLGISELRAERIDDWIFEREGDLKVLADSSQVKDLLSKNTSSSERAVKLDIDKHANIISRNIENYIKANQNATLRDLKNSTDFNSIIIQPMGKDGYTTLINKGTFIIEAHYNQSLLGTIFKLTDDENNKSIAILNEILNTNNDAFYFYNWTDPNGENMEKYVYFKIIPTRTLDNHEFILVVTGYVKDYQIINNVDQDINAYLTSFKQSHNYYNIIFISSDGDVIYMNNEMEKLGENLNWKENINTGLSINYQDAKNTKNISFFGPFAMHYGEKYMKVSFMSPVYSKDKLSGFVAIVDEMNKVLKISTELNGLWDTGDVYLVNENALLISPLRAVHLDLLTQSIRTDNMERCIGKIKNNKNTNSQQSERNQWSDEFLNYKGDLTLGVYRTILVAKWCLAAEISEEEVLQIPISNQIKGNAMIFFITMFIVLAFIFWIKIFLDKKYILKPRNILGIFTKHRGGLKN